MKKVVISLKRREDRRSHFSEVNSGLTNWEFKDAVDGNALNMEALLQNNMSTDTSWRDPFKNRKINRAEVACLLSHREAWIQCLESKEPLMILEDDAIIKDNFDEQYYESLVDEYNLIYLQRNENKPELVKHIDDVIEVPSYPYNTTGYIVTPEAAKILINTNVTSKILPADEYLPIMLPHLSPCALKEDSVKPQSRDLLPSDIEDAGDDNWLIDFKTHVITVGTDRKKCSDMNTSAALKKIYPVNIGNNVDWEGTDMSAAGGGHKINLLKEAVSKLDDDDLVLFTDAYDVIYNDNLDSIVKRYLGFHTKVLFAAEQECWPDSGLADGFEKVQKESGIETKYKFLNSGLFIGVVGELKKILQEEIQNDSDDQLYFQTAFLSGKYDIKLDYESYIFQCNESEVYFNEYDQLVNPITNCCPCIYHGNGGEVAKQKLKGVSREVISKSPDLWLPHYGGIDIIDKDMFIIDFMTQAQCEDMIAASEKHGDWGSLSYDKFPAQEIRLKQLGYWESLEKHWKKHVFPIIEEHWRPMAMYGLRDAFSMRYALDTQTSLALHTDASLVTGSVKLNDDYEGAVLQFPRQGITNEHVPVGRAIIFPGMVTHGHTCTELTKGVKYSLTMWTSRWEGDEL